MIASPLLIAELNETDQFLLKSLAHSGWSQAEIIFGSLATVTVLSFLFAYVFRKRLLRRHRRHHHRPVQNTAAATAAETGTKPKWRRLRRRHRTLNPTLAQTHGLPPLREEGTTPPPPAS